jgi:hypothetical protein
MEHSEKVSRHDFLKKWALVEPLFGLFIVQEHFPHVKVLM